MNFSRSVRVNKPAVVILLTCIIIIYYFYHNNSQTKSNNYLRNPNDINLRKLLIGSINAAQKGGIEIVSVSKQSDVHKQSKGKTKEGADDPITEADTRSDCIMSYGLNRIFPKLQIISEESDNNNKNHHSKCPNIIHFDLDPTVLHENAIIPDEIVDVNDIKVWIDPLDATQEYTEKLYKYVTTMVCVTFKGKPIIGVIHNPFTKKTTWAWVNKAISNDLSSVKKDEIPTKNPIVIVSRSHAGDVKNISKLIFGDNIHITVAAGAGYKVLQVVFNNATAYLHTTRIKKWDICAGNAILNAVGGKLTNLQNEDIDYSDEMAVVNEKGILGTLNNHEMYIKEIMLHKILQ